MSKIDFEKLTDEDALAILKNDFGALTVEHFETQIRSPKDTFWYAEQYAEEYTAEELEQAMKLEGWDKELPERVHKAVVESGLDIYHAVDTHQMSAVKCPVCEREMWSFNIEQPGSYTSFHYVTIDGDVLTDTVRHVAGTDGHYWNADPESDDAAVMCECCSHDFHMDVTRRTRRSYNGEVAVFYGDINKVSRFASNNSVIRFDFDMFYEDDLIDLYPLTGDDRALPRAVASDEISQWCDDHGYTKMTKEMIREHMDTSFRLDTKYKRAFVEVVREWADASETHPDIDYDYIIETASRGTPSVLVPDGNEEDISRHIGHSIASNQ